MNRNKSFKLLYETHISHKNEKNRKYIFIKHNCLELNQN